MKIDTLTELQDEMLTEQLKMTKKVFDLLQNKFGINHPLFVILMIKRKIKSGRARDITLRKIREWDSAV